MTRSDLLASRSFNISFIPVATICQDWPYLSLSHPHGPSSPPSEERDGFSKFEYRPAVQCDKFLPLDLEGHGHD